MNPFRHVDVGKRLFLLVVKLFFVENLSLILTNMRSVLPSSTWMRFLELLMSMILTNMIQLRYYINTNALVYPLDERFVQQISTSMADMTMSQTTGALRRIISATKVDEAQACRLDMWRFNPHYPYPPPGRNWALGMQVGRPTLPAGMLLITHTTHALEEQPLDSDHHPARS